MKKTHQASLYKAELNQREAVQYHEMQDKKKRKRWWHIAEFLPSNKRRKDTG